MYHFGSKGERILSGVSISRGTGTRTNDSHTTPIAMNAEKTIPAKITRPFSPDVLDRTRLFRVLDATAAKPVVWVSAPAGSGKTTLVASWLGSRSIPALWYQCDDGDADLATFFYYLGQAGKKAAPRHRTPLPLLTPEYRAGVATFARRYFENLCSRLLPKSASGNGRPAHAMVFDNLQEVPAHSPLHDTLATGFSCLPAGIQVFVISRTDPPPAFSRLLTNGRIELLGFRDMRFTYEEARELAWKRIPKLQTRTVKDVYAKTEGWAAGIILMLERARLVGALPEVARGPAHDRLFAYLNTEIFNKAEPQMQDILLKTALLPAFSSAEAVRLTGVDDTERVFSLLTRHHFLSQSRAGNARDYQYHPLYRDFLLSRGRSHFSPEELTALQRKAAQLLEQTGYPEDAARLYCEAADRDALVRMVINHAPDLLRQGRNKTLLEWLSCIPRDTAEEHPWLLYWSGMCSFPFDMARTRFFLEKALSLFRTALDTEGIYRAWAGIVDTYAFGLDEWQHLDQSIEEFEELIHAYPLIPSSALNLVVSSRMLFALTLRKTDQPHRVHAWLERVNALLQDNPSLDIQMDTVFSMSVYYLWKGEYHKNIIMLDKAEAEIRHRRPSPFAVIRVKLMKGIHFWITAQYGKARATLSEGLAVSAESGVHVFNSLLWGFRAAAEMASGNLAAAELTLQKQVASFLSLEQTLDLFFYHVNAAWFAILGGKPSLAADHMATIASAVEKMGTPYYRALWNIGMAHVACLQNRVADAKSYARTAHQISREMKSHVLEWNSLLCRAYILLRQGMSRDGLQALRAALSLGHRYGYVHLEFYQPAVMQYLCAQALGAGIEPQYVRELIRTLRLVPAPDHSADSSCPEGWPYPVVINTLGRFEILKDETPVVFVGKLQKKPLDLLKAVIAFGGGSVPESRLIDLLWPDADGDRGRKSLEMALSRLRQLLGGEDSIQHASQQISINRTYCRVDSLALEQIIDAAQRSTAQMPALCEKAVRLYKGQFLPADTGQHWIAAKGELLKNRLLRLIMKTGRWYEQSGEWDHAIDLYLKGLDMDYLAEELYKQLIVCYLALDNRADAVKTYNRCRSLLKAELGIEPSAETEALHASIIRTK